MIDRDGDLFERNVPERPLVRTPEASKRPDAERTISRERQAIRGPGYICRLSPAELETMGDIGRFRTVAEKDVLRFRYQGNAYESKEDIQSLVDQGLVRRKGVWTGKKGEHLSVLVLTESGRSLLNREVEKGSSQQVYSGFVKPAEVHHDAAIYRMYQAEAAKIAQAGGRIRRVVLDYELKRNVYRPLAKARSLPPIEYARKQAAVAAQNKLKVIGGKVLLPDLRIEYDTPKGDRIHVDLELATHHYRGSQMRAKAEAGFKMYAPAESAGHLTSAFDPELTAPIFSL
jgi:hypothetical protein